MFKTYQNALIVQRFDFDVQLETPFFWPMMSVSPFEKSYSLQIAGLLLSSFVVPKSGGTVHNNKAFRFPKLFVFTTYECRFNMPLFFSQ